MTPDEIKANGYIEMTSSERGQIFLKQNGTVLYYVKDDQLQLPSGRIINKPTDEDFKKEYNEYIQFPKIAGCSSCTKQ